jgi:hypothetical protein
MAAIYAYHINDVMPQFFADLEKLIPGELFQIFGGIYLA